MYLYRNNIFETNSSSTHSLVLNNQGISDYIAPNSTILVKFADTDDDYIYSTLQDKVSYLVSHIVNRYKYNAADYDSLIDDVKDSYDFRRLSDYVRDHFNKEIVFPNTYDGDLDDIVNINHQLYENSLDGVLEDICCEEHDLLDDVLNSNAYIKLGHD